MDSSRAVKKIKSIGIRRGDLIVVALLLAVSLFLLCLSIWGKGQAQSVRICVDGEQVAFLSLDRDSVYEVPGGMGNVVEISDGRVRMRSAGCPDESCVGQGFVSRTGECIVCLPARVTVTVVSDDSTDGLDAVAF